MKEIGNPVRETPPPPPIRPQQLAPVIPVAPSEQIFHYNIVLDGSFAEDRTSYEGAAKVNLDGLPGQINKVCYKEGSERWTIGFNVFKEGVDIKYQPFFWQGDAPPKELLVSNPAAWQFAGPVTLFDRNNLQEAMVQVTPYYWLKCEVRPVLCAFKLNVANFDYEENDPHLSAQVLDTRTYSNTQEVPVKYTAAFTYSKQLLEGLSITDRHSFEVGVNLHVEHSIGWIAGETTIALDLNFAYGYEHETTATAEEGEEYEWTDTVEFTLDPGQKAMVNFWADADWDASATIKVDFELSGKMNGWDLDGEYLKQLVLAQSPVYIVDGGPDWVQYRVQGLVQAAVVHDTRIKVEPIQ